MYVNVYLIKIKTNKFRNKLLMLLRKKFNKTIFFFNKNLNLFFKNIYLKKNICNQEMNTKLTDEINSYLLNPQNFPNFRISLT